MLLSEFSMFTQFEAFKGHPWNKYANFEDFCRAIVAGEQPISANPYHFYLADNNDGLLVDAVGKFEALQDDFDHVCETIGLPKTKLSHISPTVHRRYTAYYTPETLEVIYRIRKKDFQLFGYPNTIDGMESLPFMRKIVLMIKYYKHYSHPLLKIRRTARKAVKWFY
jgi:hypothetical protein